MSDSTSISPARSKWRWILFVLLTLTASLAALVLWFGDFTFTRRDPLFHGKPESEWIKNVKYQDDEQIKEWRAYKEDGVRVLIRGLENASRPGEQAYRRLNRQLPYFIRRWLPAERPDSTRSTRMCLVSLLSRLGNDARSATPVMIRTVRNDGAIDVRQIAIGYFTSSEDEKCLLNQLPADEKLSLLPTLILSIQDPRNWGLRNNAAIALKYYPEKRDVVAPVLVQALQDSQPQVRLLAAEALNRIDPEAAKQAGATAVLVVIAKHPDDQIAYRAVAALAHAGSEADLAVPALIESLQSTNTLVGCQAVWALEWSGERFASYSETIIPALRTAAQRKDNVAGYARTALTRWTEKTQAKPGKVEGIQP